MDLVPPNIIMYDFFFKYNKKKSNINNLQQNWFTNKATDGRQFDK